MAQLSPRDEITQKILSQMDEDFRKVWTDLLKYITDNVLKEYLTDQTILDYTYPRSESPHMEKFFLSINPKDNNHQNYLTIIRLMKFNNIDLTVLIKKSLLDTRLTLKFKLIGF